jgi:hypothetical protein
MKEIIFINYDFNFIIQYERNNGSGCQDYEWPDMQCVTQNQSSKTKISRPRIQRVDEPVDPDVPESLYDTTSGSDTTHRL